MKKLHDMIKPNVFKLFCFFICYCFLGQLQAQQTVGLFLNEPTSYNGYTLFNSNSSTSTYLLDNCGEMVHSWTSDYRPGLSVYLLEDGRLLKN